MMQGAKPRLLNLGCGPVTPEGWTNVDGSTRAWFLARLPALDRLLVRLRLIPDSEMNGRVMFARLSRRLPWADGTVDGIYLGEVLEHFTLSAGMLLMGECYRVLAPGGVLRIRVPDNAAFWRHYLQEFDQVAGQPREAWTDGHSRWVEMFFRDICVTRPGLLHSFGHYHKWGYDEISLTLLMERAGFHGVRRMRFHESRLPAVESVEVHDDLIVEGVKP